MAQVDLTPVIIWYVVRPNGVEVRVRSYAGSDPIKEESSYHAESDLMIQAKLTSKTNWDELDLVALSPIVGTVWGGDAKAIPLIAQDASIAPGV